MGYNMKYKKGKGFPFKTDLTKKPSIVATDLRKKEYNQSEEEQEKESDEETERINTPPATKPPLIAEVLNQDKYSDLEKYDDDN